MMATGHAVSSIPIEAYTTLTTTHRASMGVCEVRILCCEPLLCSLRSLAPCDDGECSVVRSISLFRARFGGVVNGRDERS